MSKYIDFDLIDKYPNKYNLTPDSIKHLKILDWDKLEKHTWHNPAMKNGEWFCHIEGCNIDGDYNDFSEFWIGFNKNNDTISYYFSTCDGMCNYKFGKFYDIDYIENKRDLNVQVNAIRFLNKLIDDGILVVENLMCERCNPDSYGNRIYLDDKTNKWYLDIETSDWDDYNDYFFHQREYIDFCPWCGRKLGE